MKCYHRLVALRAAGPDTRTGKQGSGRMEEIGTSRSSRRPTIVTLSQAAKVSPSTVTRALRGDTRISQKTRARILALAKEAGYTPNALARTLSSGRSGLYGIVLGSVENPIYNQILHHAARQAEGLGSRLLLLHAGAGEMEAKTAEALLQYQVDGCLISSANLSSHVAEICAANQVPLVMINRVARHHGSFVTCDNRRGGAELAAHLLQRDRRKFAIVGTSSATSTGQDRKAGFSETLKLAGVDVHLTLDGGSTYDGGFAAGQEIAALGGGDRPDAIFAVSDIMAMGVLDALRLRGVRVPDDIAVVGFDGLEATARPIYSLTTIRQPLEHMVRRAFEMLTARISQKDLPDELVSLNGQLIARNSSS